jgi:hypothetical protein
MDWHQLAVIATSAPAISFYVLVVGFLFHRIALAKQWNEEKWLGTVHAAIMSVNALGVGAHEPGWLKAAQDAFEDQYTKLHGQGPSADDLKAGVADMARLVGPMILPAIGALASKALGVGTAAPAPAPAAPVAPKPGV